MGDIESYTMHSNVIHIISICYMVGDGDPSDGLKRFFSAAPFRTTLALKTVA